MCAAPKKNEYWKLRRKNGRALRYASPQDLLQAAYRYFDWCDSHPLYLSQRSAKGVVQVPVARPFTLSGLNVYLGWNKCYLSQLKRRFQRSQDPQSKEWFYAICRIENIIYTQKFEGAAAGIFNASIIIRELGLRDKRDT